MNLSTLVDAVAARRPNHPAIVFEGRSLTYEDVRARSAAAAARLVLAGVGEGDRVGLLLPNVPAFAAALYGALRIGAIAVPLNPTLTADELEVMILDAGIRTVVTVDTIELEERTRVLLDEVVVMDESGTVDLGVVGAEVHTRMVRADAPAVIVFSSGTTGRPKGVTLSHANVISNLRSNVADIGMTADDRVMLFMPLFHCYGLNVIMNSAFVTGATVVLERKFDPHCTPRTIADERVTMFFGVPTTFIVLLQHETLDRLSSLRWCYCAAAPLPREIEDRWTARTGLIVTQAYGLSEAAPCVSFNPDHAYRPGSIGLPGAGVEMRVVDPETEQDVAEGEVGELWVKSPGVMLGYWDRPEATAAVMRDGWLRTGDLGRRDADGYYYVTDRLKDMINSGGMKVYPAEVENALYRHPAVGEAAVVGVPHETMGEVTYAYVSPKKGMTLDPDVVLGFLAGHLAAYKRPAVIRIVDLLPKGRTGKILRREVRRRARQHVMAADRPRLSERDLQRWIVGWMRRELQLGDGARIAADGAFAEAGIDSLMAVRKAEALSNLLGRPIAATVTWLYPTPEQLARHLVGHLVENAAPAAPRPRSLGPRAISPVDGLAPVESLSATEAEDALLAELAALGM